MKRPFGWMAWIGLATFYCAPPIQHGARESRPNILVIIGDDMGVETLRSFGIGTDTPDTPTLDELATRGVRFTNVWAQAMCSPTRATILTGRYGFRTGVGRPTGVEVMGPMPEPPAVPEGVTEFIPTDGSVGGSSPPSWGIRSDEMTLPQTLRTRPDLGYQTAAFGKWHLADVRNGWEKHPNLVGFDYFSGLIRCCPESYFAWVKLVNGEFSTETGYAVSDKVDDALDWLAAQEGDHPWFVWLAFNTAHTPIHLPPQELLRSDYSHLDPNDPEQDRRPYFKAMIEAMDTEIGRLLGAIDRDVLDNTYVIFLGDNGTDSDVVAEPFRAGHVKATVYNGGVHVPLLITGPGVTHGEQSDALVNTTDLFATLLDMAGAGLKAVPDDIVLDTISLMPYLTDPETPSIREWIYTDLFVTDEGVQSGQYAIRNEGYKLLVRYGAEEFYDLTADPYEYHDLLDGELSPPQRAQYESLRSQVEALHSSER